MKKIAFFIVGFILLCLISLYLLRSLNKNTQFSTSPQSQNTQNAKNITWKTYTNNKRGFTFKYPSNLFVVPGQVNEFVVLSETETVDWSSANGIKMVITIFDNPNNLPIEEFENSSSIPNTHPRTYTFKKALVNGNEVTTVTVSGCEAWEGCPSKLSYEKFIKGNRYIINIHTPFWNEQWTNQLVSSIKFNQ